MGILWCVGSMSGFYFIYIEICFFFRICLVYFVVCYSDRGKVCIFYRFYYLMLDYLYEIVVC